MFSIFPRRCRRGRSPSACNRIRWLCRRGRAFPALPETFLTDLDGREPSDQSKAAKTQKSDFFRSHFFETVTRA